MSVCIATACESRKKIVLVTDNRASFGDFSAEGAVLKNWPLAPNWVAIYAGNDIEHADPIIRAVRKEAWKLAVRSGGRVKAEEIVSIVDEAYSEQLQAHIENKILRKHNFSGESFLKTGKLKCTPDVFAKTWERIDKERFSLRFMVAGFGEENDDAHIWVIDGDKAPVSHNSIGFWSIGTGAAAAMSSLSFHVSRKHLSVYSSSEEAVYFSLAAKFMAESASDVGKSTFVVILSNHEKEPLEYVSNPGIEQIRMIWEKHGVPRVPSRQIDNVVAKLIHGELKTLGDVITFLAPPKLVPKITKELAKQSASQTSKSGP